MAAKKREIETRAINILGSEVAIPIIPRYFNIPGLDAETIAEMAEQADGKTANNLAEYNTLSRSLKVLKTFRTQVKDTALEARNAIRDNVTVQISEEEKRVYEELDPIIEPLAKTKKDYDDKKKAEKAERERREQERLDAIQANIGNILALVSKAHDMPMEGIEGLPALIERMENEELDENVYQERFYEACNHHYEVLKALRAICQQREDAEAYRKQVAADAQAKLDQDIADEKHRKEREKELEEREAAVKQKEEAQAAAEKEEAEIEEVKAPVREVIASSKADATKIEGYFTELRSIEAPKVRSNAFKNLMERFNLEFDQLLNRHTL